MLAKSRTWNRIFYSHTICWPNSTRTMTLSGPQHPKYINISTRAQQVMHASYFLFFFISQPRQNTLDFCFFLSILFSICWDDKNPTLFAQCVVLSLVCDKDWGGCSGVYWTMHVLVPVHQAMCHNYWKKMCFWCCTNILGRFWKSVSVYMCRMCVESGSGYQWRFSISCTHITGTSAHNLSGLATLGSYILKHAVTQTQAHTGTHKLDSAPIPLSEPEPYCTRKANSYEHR